MIKIGKKIFGLIFSIINWSEILNGFVLVLLGMAFTHYYGYQIRWGDYVNICLWYFFYKIALFCLSALISGEVYQNCVLSELSNLKLSEFRVLVVKYFWVITIAFFAISFLPLYQLMELNRLNRLSLMIITIVYLGDLIFLITNFQRMFTGLSEVVYGFTTAFLLPALYFSVTIGYIKPALILVTFPLFLQFIAWKASLNLVCTISNKVISLTSMIEKIGVRDTLYTTSALLLLGCMTLFLDINIIDLANKIIVLPLGLGAAWLTFRSVASQHPNWERALALIRLLPLTSSLSIILSLWLN